ncbi:MAG TPA: prepilin peptidase [Caldilineales bacterium]|nr:prepilin peptidase [Caldilineales bacterium]
MTMIPVPLRWLTLGLSLGALAASIILLTTRYWIVRYGEDTVWLTRARSLAVFLLASGWGGVIAWRTLAFQPLLVALILTILLGVIALVDYAVLRIPNAMIILLLFWAGIQTVWLGQPSPGSALLGFLTGSAGFLFLAILGRGALGMGDVKLAGAIGALFGFPDALYALFWGVMLGGVAALYLLIARKAGLKSAFAYAPYLAAGAWILAMLGLWA